MNRELILYIAMSLDGYIAGKDDNIDFLNIVDIEGEDFGHSEFLKSIDTIIWGRRTYDKLLSFGIDFPYPDKKCYVLSKTKSGKDENVEFINEDINGFITGLINSEGKNIYCDGGGEIVFELLKNNLIDKIIISVIPCLVGNGIKLFKDGRPFQKLNLIDIKKYKTGLVQLSYEVIKN